EKARGQRFDGGWDAYLPPQPNQSGVHAFDWPLEDLLPYIDWTPFFQAWELAGKYPAILQDAVVGGQASELFRDAQAMLKRIVAEKWLTARAVYGIWPAASHGDDVVLQHAGGPATLHFLRQQVDKPADRPDFCLADFVAPHDSGVQDWIGAFAVTAGIGIDEHVARFEAEHDDYNAILLKSLADRLAEALAERLHQRVRREFWRYASADRPDFCLADFVAPHDSGVQDWIGAFAVTAGIGIDEHVARFEAEHDDYNAILLKSLADRLAEALAERLHQRVRREFWGYAAD